METFPTKTGSTVGILLASILLQRYLFRSLRLALASITTTEVAVFLIVVQVTGLASASLSDLAFNFGWLFTLTWNVVAAFLVGILLGSLWNQKALLGDNRKCPH